MFELENIKIGIVGLGYVGLPLAVELGKNYPTKGLDISASRVAELQSGRDSTLEVEPDELKQATQLSYNSDPQALADCNFYIVTVPTPIDSA
ncbi:MAG TPA: Vi polysaccharide biosynthesis UDP-N-acetylglucosamine C-6 dehydrogenase TviB, partial [Chromatiales bacterium]|nr:Vi polysaccharide biosynthesis UDP-N-acetylglucosamine C-6 dehydrogenase TviB [Chromatiales bacterium]HEX22006.1 Vi polysaccharide biosynthesis UDP-N-acetylglucosamine C-6 dehydrogenase TviB [Chromatiales bacterium]